MHTLVLQCSLRARSRSVVYFVVFFLCLCEQTDLPVAGISLERGEISPTSYPGFGLQEQRPWYELVTYLLKSSRFLISRLCKFERGGSVVVYVSYL